MISHWISAVCIHLSDKKPIDVKQCFDKYLPVLIISILFYRYVIH